MRAIAVALVFVSHAGLGNIVPGGLGVTIFFFLSGYLITSLMRDEYQSTGRFSIKDFYIRRCLRILPPMWIAMVLAALLAESGLIATTITGPAIVAQVLFLSNYADLWNSTQGVPGIPLWSLAVEEHFYLLFPVFFVVLLASRTMLIAAKLCFAACMVFLAFRCIEYALTNSTEMMYYRSHLRMDSILFGCCLAFWQNPILDRGKAWKPRWLPFGIALALILMTIVIRNSLFRETLRYTVQGIALFVIYSFILSSISVVTSVLRSWPLQVIGRFSYSIYLVHVPLLMLVDQNMASQNMAVRGVMAAALTVLTSWAINVLVEKPLARIRKRFSTHGPVEPPTQSQLA